MVGGLTNHLKMRHPNQAEFKCFEHCHFDCEEKFQNYWDLVNHIRNHYNINNKSEKETNFEKKKGRSKIEMQCNQCQKVILKGKESFMNHVLRKHLDELGLNSEKMETLCCSEYSGIMTCDFSVLSSDLEEFKSHFVRHFKPKPTPKKPKRNVNSDRDIYGGFKVFCEICGNFPMKFIKGLVTHLDTKHLKKKEFKCANHCDFEGNICDESFKTIKDLTEHITKHLKEHQKTLSFKCSRCDKIYQTPRQLLRHERQKHKVFAEPYQSEVDQVQNSSKPKFVVHVQI